MTDFIPKDLSEFSLDDFEEIENILKRVSSDVRKQTNLYTEISAPLLRECFERWTYSLALKKGYLDYHKLNLFKLVVSYKKRWWRGSDILIITLFDGNDNKIETFTSLEKLEDGIKRYFDKYTIKATIRFLMAVTFV